MEQDKLFKKKKTFPKPTATESKSSVNLGL